MLFYRNGSRIQLNIRLKHLATLVVTILPNVFCVSGLVRFCRESDIIRVEMNETRMFTTAPYGVTD